MKNTISILVFLKIIIFIFILFQTNILEISAKNTKNTNTDQQYIKENIDGYDIEYIKVKNSKESNYNIIMVPATGEGQFLGDIMIKYKAVSGINGAYFSPKAYGNKKNTTKSEKIHNNIIQGNLNNTEMRVIFGFDKNFNNIIYQSGILKINTNSGKEIKEGIANFPLLLLNGKDVTINRKTWIDMDKKMTELRDKNFICADKNNWVYMGSIKKISIYDMSKILKKIGCNNALNLDAGASSSLVYNGSRKINGWSPIMDAILITKKTELTKEEQEKLEKLSSGYINNIKYGIYEMYQKYKRNFK